MSRIETKFVDLKSKNKSAFVTFLMAGDPDLHVSQNLFKKLPKLGVDIIEIGMPFTDPMADGLLIQKAGQRSLSNETNLNNVFNLVEEIRKEDNIIPIILMGYYNPIYSMGVRNFLNKSKKSGVDGFIIVDLPPEEDQEFCMPARKMGLDFIRLATPTTTSKRLPKVLKNTSGFIYYVSVTGITGSRNLDIQKVEKQVKIIKNQTTIPVCVGFGIKTPEDAKSVSSVADGVVVGSSIIELIEKNQPLDKICNYIKSLADAVHS
ncbi:MAG: tryptophan synthase subunit alpha [Paracoccaceae bacterium]